MKKMIVLVMVAFAANVFAVNPGNYNVFSKLNNKASFNTLVIYLNAEQDQIDYLKHVLKVTDEEMRSAQKNGNNLMAVRTLEYNLHNTKCILSDEQYKKYLEFVILSSNLKLIDKSFDNEVISDNNK